ncbi:unnamed protein product, partial [marine sediment metagenome]
KMENKEVRTIHEFSEIRADKKSRNVEGLGIVFNKESRDLGGFIEIILPEAMEGVIENSDILALLDHQKQRGVLARSVNGKGSLATTITAAGVRYNYTAPNTPLGDEVREGIQRKDIRGSSFSFTIAKGGDKIEKRSDGVIVRTIKQFDKIFDISAVYTAAYTDTTVALRSLDEYNKANPPIDKTIEDKLARPKLTNEELAMRSKNNYHIKN